MAEDGDGSHGNQSAPKGQDRLVDLPAIGKSAARLVAVGGATYGVLSGLQAFGITLLAFDTVGLIIYCSIVLNLFLIAEIVLLISRTKNRTASDPVQDQFPSSLLNELEDLHGSRDYSRILRYRTAFSRLLWIEGHLAERVRLGELAEDAAVETGNRHEQAAALIDDLGWTKAAMKDYTAAEKHIRHGLTVAAEVDSEYWMAKGWRHLGGLSTKQGREADAYANLSQALTFAENIPEALIRDEMVAGIEYGIAECAYRSGDDSKALDHLNRSDALRKQVGDTTRTLRAYSLRGRIFLAMREASQAKDEFRRGLKEAREVGRRDEEITNLVGLTRVASLEQREGQAAAYRQQVEKLLEETPAPGVLESFRPEQ